VNNLNAQEADPAAAEAIFNKTRIAISRASDGAQVPSVSSSLFEDVSFGVHANAAAARAVRQHSNNWSDLSACAVHLSHRERSARSAG